LDVKINSPELLSKEIKRKKIGTVWMSGVCDPYQPAEEKYELTRQCLEILSRYGWPVTIQTKSPLVLRDMALIKKW
jgi:DNA repair photolyase